MPLLIIISGTSKPQRINIHPCIQGIGWSVLMMLLSADYNEGQEDRPMAAKVGAGGWCIIIVIVRWYPW